MTVSVHLRPFFFSKAGMYELSSMNNDKNSNTVVDISLILYVSQVHLPVFLLCLLVSREAISNFYLLTYFCILSDLQLLISLITHCLYSQTAPLAIWRVQQIFLHNAHSLFKNYLKQAFRPLTCSMCPATKERLKLNLWQCTPRNRIHKRCFWNFFV